MYVRNCSKGKNVIYKAHKGYNPMLEDNIFFRFCGRIINDYDTTLYSYGTKRYECNILTNRYLEELIQNVKEIYLVSKMKELLF